MVTNFGSNSWQFLSSICRPLARKVPRLYSEEKKVWKKKRSLNISKKYSYARAALITSAIRTIARKRNGEKICSTDRRRFSNWLLSVAENRKPNGRSSSVTDQDIAIWSAAPISLCKVAQQWSDSGVDRSILHTVGDLTARGKSSARYFDSLFKNAVRRYAKTETGKTFATAVSFLTK